MKHFLFIKLTFGSWWRNKLFTTIIGETFFPEQKSSVCQKKQHIVACLVILQYIISIGLMIAFIVIRNQLQQIEQGGDSYKNVFEITSKEKLSLRPLYDEMQHMSSISYCRSNERHENVIL